MQWPTAKLKYVVRFAYGDPLPADREVSEGVPVYGSNGVYAFHVLENTQGPAIIVGRKGSYGKVNWSDVPCFASDTTFFIDETTTQNNLRWVYWLLQTLRLDEGSNEAAVPGLNRETAYENTVAIPSIFQQRAIADYLDRETTKLDSLVAAKERLLGLLGDKRRALITRAVIRGLNPDAPLRESGFSWLGPIPSHWEIIKLKYIAAISYGVGDELDKSLTSGVPLISLPNVSLDGTLDLTGLGWAALNESGKMQLLLNKGDLLFNWRNGSSEHLAKTAYFEADGEFTHVGFLLRIRFDLSRFASRFYQAFLNALRVRGFFLYSRAMVNNTFNQTELANLPVVVPPLHEQRSIVAHIEAETAKLDSLREAARRTIRLLKERRAALIAAAVTGKIRSFSSFAEGTENWV
jgi:type I restriction enzyme, S subunit